MGNKASFLLFATAFLAFGIIGANQMQRSWDGVVYFFPSKNLRTPAAIHKTFDFSTLNGQALTQASKKRLVENIKINNADDVVYIELGNFVQKGAMGKKQFACATYSLVSLTFIATGIAINGKPPIINVLAPCRVSQKLSRLKPITVPFKNIFVNKPGNYEFNFWNLGQTKVVTQNIPAVWPKNWELRDVKLIGQSKNIHITTEEISDLSNKKYLITL